MVTIDPKILETLSRHEFLSPEWLEEFKDITRRLKIEAMEVQVPLRMNQLISGCPFQKEPLSAFLDTSDGHLVLDTGALENPDLTVALDYDTARAMFVEMSPQRAVEAFLAGKIMVTGDMTKLLGLAQVFAGKDGDDAMSSIIRAITS